MNNIKNVPVSTEILENLINKYTGNMKVTVNNINLLQKAFMQKSFCKIDNDGNIDEDLYCVMMLPKRVAGSNERLEFLGDVVIKLIAAEFLCDKYPYENQGFLSKLRSKIEEKPMLASLADRLGFRKYLFISCHQERVFGRNNERFLEDVFESFMGALYKDQGTNGLAVCKAFLLGVMKEFIDLDDLIKNNDNFKDMLLRYFQDKAWGHPVYHTIFHTGETCRRLFTSILILKKSILKSCSNYEEIHANHLFLLDKIKNENSEGYEKTLKLLEDGLILSLGTDKSKKKSEQNASEECMKLFKVEITF